MLVDVLLVVIGVALLTGGGQLFVTGSARLAQALGISPVVVGVVVIGFGTSAPEMVASVLAAVQGRAGVAFGNLVGSNISNIGLVLGVAALVAPAVVTVTIVRREALISTAAALLFIGLALNGGLSTLEGIVLIVAFSGAMGWLLWRAWHERGDRAAMADEVEGLVGPDPGARAKLLEGGRALLGLALVLVGAELTVRGAVAIALAAGVDEGFVGLTVVGIGTSLPELVTGIIAAARRETDLVVGNVLGSNVFNLLLIGGTVGLVTSAPIPAAVVNPGLPVLASGSLGLLVFLRAGFVLRRWEAAILLAGYAGYIVLLGLQL
ncbi:MAG: sodium:calcium antiporter [Dehalococcoidia bacterium]|nr:sodium:calcium antiporter [Dehalococcoidia bacterium]